MCLVSFLFNYKNNIFKEIININKVKAKKVFIHNIKYYLESYIITSKLMDIIKSIFNNKEIDIPKQKIIFRDKYLYFVYPKKIIIGDMDKNYIFNSKYLFSYSSTEIFESEKENLFNVSIEEYIKSINCDLNNYELQSIMKDNKKLGKFIIIQKDKSIENQSNLSKIIDTENNNKDQKNSNINPSDKNICKENQFGIKSSEIDGQKKNINNITLENNNFIKIEQSNKNKTQEYFKDEKNANEQLQNKEELNKYNESLLKSENDYENLKAEFSEIEKIFLKKEKQLKNQSEINKLYKKQILENEKEIKELTQKIKQFSLDNNNKEENIKKLNNDIEEKVKLINNLKNSKKELKEKNIKVNEEIEKLKDKEEKQNNRLNDLVKENKKLKEKNKENGINEIKFNKEINELREKINNLEKELKEEKNKNKILEKNIFKLKRELEYIQDKILNKNKESLYKTIIDKEEEIKILQTKLSRFPFELNKNEKLMTIIFTTYDENFYYSVICKNTERFNIIENKLYDVYSDYSNPENYFFVNGRKINKVKTLEQNGIKNNSIIIINKMKK